MRLKNIIPILVLALLAACTGNDDLTTADATAKDEVQISFVLSLSGEQTRPQGTRTGQTSRQETSGEETSGEVKRTPATRAATWEDKNNREETKTEYENKIDPTTLQVLLYKKGDGGAFTYAAKVEALSFYQDATNATQYVFQGMIDPSAGNLSAGDYKIMVIANADEVSPTAGTDLSNLALTYAYNEADVKAGEQLIPMWGVTTQTLSLEKGKMQDIGGINLLRAFAKVEINISDEAKAYTITSATLTRHNTDGNVMPKDFDKTTATAKLYQSTSPTGETLTTFNPTSSSSSVTDPSLGFTKNSDNNKAWIYIPEYDNSTTAATISLQVTNGVEGDAFNNKTFTLNFTHDNNNDPEAPYDIVRNHIYRYTVNVERMAVEYEVALWDVVESSIGYAPTHVSTTANPFTGDALPENQYILLPAANYNKDYPTTLTRLNYLYQNADEGDPEAYYGVLLRPRYANDDTGKRGTHKTLRNDTGGATFFFLLTGPAGATWEAHLTNTEDFELSTAYNATYFKNATEEGVKADTVYKVTHGIAGSRPYVIQINAKNNYTGVAVGGSTDDPQGNNKKGDDYLTDDGNASLPESWTDEAEDTKWGELWKPRFGDDYLTEFGKEHWYGQKVIDTEFYITVKLDDGAEYELEINPSYTDGVLTGGLYNDNRRYPGTSTRIWVRQLRAQYDWSYGDLAKDVDPTDSNNFQWWRVNPYWKKQ